MEGSKPPIFNFDSDTNDKYNQEMQKAREIGMFEKAKNGDTEALAKLGAKDVGQDIIFKDERFTKLKDRIDKQVKKVGHANKFLYLYRLRYLEQLLDLTREQLLNNIIDTLNECGKAYTARFYGFNSVHQFNWLDITGCTSEGRAYLPYLHKTVRVYPNSPQWVKDREFVRFIYEVNPECFKKISTPKGWRVQKFPELVDFKDWIEKNRLKFDETVN